MSGEGIFAAGSRTVTATANSGYTFASWSENGAVVSTSANYNFNLTTNRDLVANFVVSPLQIVDLTVNPPRLTITSKLGLTNVIQYASQMPAKSWITLDNLVVTNSPYVYEDKSATADSRFYRVWNPGYSNNFPTISIIPAATYNKGNYFGSDGSTNELRFTR